MKTNIFLKSLKLWKIWQNFHWKIFVKQQKSERLQFPRFLIKKWVVPWNLRLFSETNLVQRHFLPFFCGKKNTYFIPQKSINRKAKNLFKVFKGDIQQISKFNIKDNFFGCHNKMLNLNARISTQFSPPWEKFPWKILLCVVLLTIKHRRVFSLNSEGIFTFSMLFRPVNSRRIVLLLFYFAENFLLLFCCCVVFISDTTKNVN